MDALRAPSGTGDDKDAVEELHRLHHSQRAAFLADPYPSAAERRTRLEALAAMVLRHRREIRAAMRDDFAAHPDLFTDLVEVLGVAARAAYAAEHLETWMAEDERPLDPGMYGGARAGVRYQPKGVIGTIVPWNFPFDLSLGPLVEMLAAGNRVIIKPSEHAPACAQLLVDMVAATFGEDQVAVLPGGLELARTFPTLRWDHLLYTGNPDTGRLVALAAADNLVPVTLELGGKCPAVLAPDSVDAATVGTVLGTKLIKNGQMCITVDYVLVPRRHVGTFVTLATQYMERELPDHASSADCTGIITEGHAERIAALLDEAREAGARIVPLGGRGDAAGRRLPLTLVADPPDRLRIMREEIFGPVLPVVPYDDLDQATDWINARERPLGLYVFSSDAAAAERVLHRTTSGGACVNVCAVQGALPSLGFGGVGRSGTGRHHGIEGFREFSNPRGVVVRGTGDLMDVFLPPYGHASQAVVDAAFAQFDGGGDA